MMRQPPRSPLFPYPTLFRSRSPPRVPRRGPPLRPRPGQPAPGRLPGSLAGRAANLGVDQARVDLAEAEAAVRGEGLAAANEIGRASGRGRGEISVVAASLKKKHIVSVRYRI